MSEYNNPIDIGPSQIKKYQDEVEETLSNFAYQHRSQSLPDLIRGIDHSEPHIMTHVETDTYLTLREGVQIYNAMFDVISEKVGLKKRLIEVPAKDIMDDPTLGNMREFANNYATFSASTYVSKKLETLINTQGGVDEDEKHDLSFVKLNIKAPKKTAIRHLLAPMYAKLVEHKVANEDDSASTVGEFQTPLEFPLFVKDVFDKYKEIALSKKATSPEFQKHLEGYTFRIMDDYVTLEGFEDRSIPTVVAQKQNVSFQPIESSEIVGNQSAKRKISRYIDRLALYNPAEQMNQVISLGGLSWTNLFDGPPGTGKSSLFRLAMTLLQERADALEMPYNIITVDQSIKDEYYGKTGKILLERLAVTKDSNALTLAIFDDIDLLTSNRGDAQGADNDVNNILMQYLDGVFTVRRGNVINLAASNEPTGLDNALRNRFSDRLLIDGPVTAEDFADITMLMAGSLLDKGLLKMAPGNYTPFATQDMKSSDGLWSGGDVSEYLASDFSKYKDATLIDFGNYMAELKGQNELITGRSMKAIMDAVKERTANFDVPIEWVTNHSAFHEKAPEMRENMLKELYNSITPDILFQEAQRYFDSEERFKSTEADGHVNKGYNSRMWDLASEIKFLEGQIGSGNSSQLSRLQSLKMEKGEILAKAQETIIEAETHAQEAEQ